MREITLELTDKCLNNCLHCSGRANINGTTFLDMNTIKEMIDKYDPEWVNISGGEPLLHPEIYSIILYIHDKGKKIKLYTSGCLPDFNIVLDKIYNLIDVIIFPYYTSDESTFNFLVGNVNGIDYVNNAISICGAYGMNIEAHIVPMKQNLYHIDTTIRSLLHRDIKKINILKLVKQGRVNDNPYIIPHETPLKKILSKIKDDYNDKIKLGLPLNEGECCAGKEKMVIMCNGKEIPCESYKDGVCKCERIKIK